MHVPDGFLDAPTSIGTGVVAAAAIGVALKGARRELDDRTAPLAGLVAAFIFATQMLNFPVASGTSGHLLGGALAAILVGPYTGLLCMATVFLVQCLLFADGGITALGTNIDLMGLVTVVVGWSVFKALQAVLPKRLAMVAPSAAAAALVSVPVAALGFVLLYAIGGTADIALSNLAAAMIGVHVLIGIGESVITFLAVTSIVAVRPDLVYGARPVLEKRELVLRTTPTETAA
jgi:cobalt/nickel transport system permease protein